jgi:hypothetical protein
MKFTKFVPLAKMEEQSDGTLHVYGLVTEEKPDLDNEVCDYATTAPLYQKRTQERQALTAKVEGMTPSLMAMRAQHDPKQAIGAGRSLVCDDTAKTIKMGFHIVDIEAVKKWKAGVFVGFSQGGEYAARWDDLVFKGCTRYTADPMEVSSVDSPCLPSALAESMKGRTVTLFKSAGTTEEVSLQILPEHEARLVKAEREIETLRQLLKDAKTKTVDGVALTASCFAHVGDPEDPETWKLPIKFPGDDEKTKSHIRNALARFEQTEGMSAEEKKAAKKKILAAAKEHGIETSDADKVAISRVCATISVEKGLYEVGWLGDLIESLHWLCLQTEFERDIEDDGSNVPAEMRETWLKLIETFKAMAIEEADELAAAGKGEKGMKLTDLDSFKKAAKTIADHLEKHMEMHKAHHEKLEATMAKEHPLVKSSQAMMDHCDKCMKAAKDGMDGEEPKEEEKNAPTGDLVKAEARIAAMEKSLAETVELLKKLPANTIIPHTGAGGTVSKVAEFESLLTN